MGSGGSVAVTGASGFIGRGAVRALCQAGLEVRAISRQPEPGAVPNGARWFAVPDYGDARTLEPAIAGSRCVIHLADNPDRNSARAAEAARNAASLVRAMTTVGASRLVLASSVYAQPDSGGGQYGAAKRAAEAEVLAAPELQAVILRMPPVYGPGSRGGFGTLVGMARRGLPLPLARATARRAYLSRRNLCDLLVAIARADDAQWTAAAGQRFEPSDGEPVGTADLVRMLALACSRPNRQFPAPLWLLRGLGHLTRRAATVSSALDPLDVAGNEPLTRAFGWTPAERMPASLSFVGVSR